VTRIVDFYSDGFFVDFFAAEKAWLVFTGIDNGMILGICSRFS
jgi:hypothetical protein